MDENNIDITNKEEVKKALAIVDKFLGNGRLEGYFSMDEAIEKATPLRKEFYKIKGFILDKIEVQ